MKTIIFRYEILIMMSLFIIACSRPSSEIPESSLDSDKVGIEVWGPLSSIDDYLSYSHTGEQWIGVNDVKLKIDGLVEYPLEMNYNQVLNHKIYSNIATLKCIEGWSVRMRWEGVRVEDLIKEAGIKENASLVIFHSFDGYKTYLFLHDVLTYNMILAYKVNGVLLPLKLGFPFQLVAEGQDGLSWVKGVAEIELQ
jgi:DMSO/TMAO reductase YedYZ molybdopterin-dependent catalytic subunit